MDAQPEGIRSIMDEAIRNTGRMMWTIIVLVGLLCLVNYLDRVVISFAIEPIRRDFGVDNTGFGLAMTLFAAGAITINLISGLLLDRFGVRMVWLAGLLVWTAAMFMLGVVEYWWLFLVFRVGLGLGEGVNFPAMNRAIRDWVPPRHASKVTAACLIGVPGAFLIGGPLFGWLISEIGWRSTFKILSAAGFVLMLAILIFYRNPIKTRRNSDSDTGAAGSWLGLLKDPTLLATSWSFFGFGVILYFGLDLDTRIFRTDLRRETLDHRLVQHASLGTCDHPDAVGWMVVRCSTSPFRRFSQIQSVLDSGVSTSRCRVLHTARVRDHAMVGGGMADAGHRMFDGTQRTVLLDHLRSLSRTNRCRDGNHDHVLLGVRTVDAGDRRPSDGHQRKFRGRFHPDGIDRRQWRGGHVSLRETKLRAAEDLRVALHQQAA